MIPRLCHILLFVVTLFTVPAFADAPAPDTLPQGGQVVDGQASLTQSGARLDITQTTPRTIINWQSFNIGQGAHVNYTQPDASSVALNRVLSTEASQIYGRLTANGQVFLVNPSGVIFGAGSRVDVGGLVASTLNIGNDDFMAGRLRFERNGATGGIRNLGSLTAADGGYIALLAPEVINEGVISARLGSVAFAAGDRATLSIGADGQFAVALDPATINTLVENRQLVQADGGSVLMSAKAADTLLSAVVANPGAIEARTLENRNGVVRLLGDTQTGDVMLSGSIDVTAESSNTMGGTISIEGDYITQLGRLDATGGNGGNINLNARAILDAGTALANGTAGIGGTVTFTATDAIIQASAASAQANGTSTGGSVHLQAENSMFSSGNLSATGREGGTIDIVGHRVVLAAASLDTSGTTQGGLIRVGGDFQGANPALPNAETTIVNGSTTLKADGGNGKVVVWSDEQTDYYGSISAKDRGNIEVSSKGTLNYAGSADAGLDGNLLLDPANIIISASGGPAAYELLDPHPATDNYFGTSTTLLGTTVNEVFTENGKIVITSPGDSLAAANAGAAYLYDATTGALISSLTGTTAGDYVGSYGVIALTNGNYVVRSPSWHNGAVANAGAATWGSGTTGINGAVTSVNSLVGTSTGDQVGRTYVDVLSNGNYVVRTFDWDNGAAVDAGAVTWGNGATGISGPVSSLNSLVGSTTNDKVGQWLSPLSNGNYVVSSPYWDNGVLVDVGAATWGNGTTGISGVITSLNSLVGTTSGDSVAYNGVWALSNGNYVVSSPYWSNGAVANAGAATWGNGTTGINGAVTSLNSLVGTTTDDRVSLTTIKALSNGNYVVLSEYWNNGAVAYAGAATWGNGTTGINGAVTSLNSLVGTTAYDMVGERAYSLTNGNYVVTSSHWDNGVIANAGAVTWGNGTTGINGAVSSLNSLVGTTANDLVGGGHVYSLTNGNYVVSNPYWHNGAASNAGAVTWGNGTTGINGAVTSLNSLVGTTTDDKVGIDCGIFTLSNGNYVVKSPYWDNGGVVDTGAVTWGSGTLGVSGTVTSLNSLVGTSADDRVGWGGVAALTDGNYVVSNPYWDNGAVANVGAVTWGNGATGISGAVTSINSLTGTTMDDYVGSYGVTALYGGNYVVNSPDWDNGAAMDAGAVTWANGTTGLTGTITNLNSLVGTATNDYVGGWSTTALANGNYVMSSPYYASNAGKVLIGTPGDISFANGTGQTMTFNPSSLTATLAGGTAVTLQASNDITINSAITVGGATGGAFSLQAGRNININSTITTANGNFTAIAGDPGAIPADRQAGTPTITLGAGSGINTGSGTATLAAIGGNFINNSGSEIPIAASRWFVYSTDPTQNARGGMTEDGKHYAQSYTGITPAYATSGNWFLYSVSPTLLVTPSAQTVTYGTAPGSFTPSYTGFIDGDLSNTAGISGTATFTVAGPTSVSGGYIVGSHDVSYAGGLSSSLGYTFANNAGSDNELTVNAASVNTVAPEDDEEHDSIVRGGDILRAEKEDTDDRFARHDKLAAKYHDAGENSRSSIPGLLEINDEYIKLPKEE